MSDPLILAIDLGTSACKVALCRRDGVLLTVARRPIPVAYPRPSWAEVDANDWWEALRELVPEAIRSAGIEPDRVGAIGLCGLMHALVPVREDGLPLAPSMLWMDQRCREECEYLIEAHGERIEALTGWVPRTTRSAPKLLWLRRHRPEIVEATHRFLLPKDFVRLKLTGEWATDPSDAIGTDLLSRESPYRWAEPYVTEILGVSIEKLPPIQPSTSFAGTLTPEAASTLGLPVGIPVVTGVSDVRATGLGTNLFESGRCCLYMGTAAWLALGTEESEPNELRARFLGATSTFGAAMRWWVETLGRHEDRSAYAELERLAAEVEPGAEGLLFLPHLMGERGPYRNPSARGVLFGVTLRHTPGHLFRAALEGTAFQIRHLLEAANACDRLSELWCVGGGTRLRLWLRILADVTSVPVVLPREREAALLGAAMTAAVGAGIAPNLQAVAASWVRPDERIEPESSETYEESYARYRALDAAMQPFFEPET